MCLDTKDRPIDEVNFHGGVKDRPIKVKLQPCFLFNEIY